MSEVKNAFSGVHPTRQTENTWWSEAKRNTAVCLALVLFLNTASTSLRSVSKPVYDQTAVIYWWLIRSVYVSSILFFAKFILFKTFFHELYFINTLIKTLISCSCVQGKLVPSDEITVFYRTTGTLSRVIQEFQDFIFATIKQPLRAFSAASPISSDVESIVSDDSKVISVHSSQLCQWNYI